jgi:hypothetical protein
VIQSVSRNQKLSYGFNKMTWGPFHAIFDTIAVDDLDLPERVIEASRPSCVFRVIIDATHFRSVDFTSFLTHRQRSLMRFKLCCNMTYR